MKVAEWHPEVFDELTKIAYDRLLAASYFLKDVNVRKLRGKIGSRKTTGINRPVYKKGKDAGQQWTARDFGQLLKSLRVVEKREKYGTVLTHYKNIWLMCGNYLAFYADIFEFYTPFMRPALNESIGEIKAIMGVQ